MVRSANEMLGHKLGATDGHIGHVKDFYFDETRWVVRYLVADTGTWLTGRLVLISPLALGGFDASEKILRVNLSRRQIEDSPSVELHKPISRQFEEEYYQFYNWPFYWQGAGLWGATDMPFVPAVPMLPPVRVKSAPEDLHLNNAHAVFGYSAHAVDKDVGTVADFLIDDQSWSIPGLVVDTGHWLPGRKSVVSTTQVGRISWSESKVFLKTTSLALARAPAYEAVA